MQQLKDFKVDINPPVFNTPALTVTLTTNLVTVTANVVDLCSGIEKVQFYRNGLLFLAPVNTPPWSITYPATGPPTETMFAIAYDLAGNQATSPIINLDNLQLQQNSQQIINLKLSIPILFQILQQIINNK